MPTNLTFRSGFRFLFVLILLAGCQQQDSGNFTANEDTSIATESKQFLVVLGVAQDAGYPQANCEKKCCSYFWNGSQERGLATCLGIVDEATGKCWMLEATPSFTMQLQMLKNSVIDSIDLNGIFLTHAHIGHYAGLINLGQEVMGADQIPVFAMPRMAEFLRSNGPWDQLVNLKNIDLQPLRQDSAINLTTEIQIVPFLVPHRDEYSETVGYKVITKNTSVLFIPDIDKWNKWDRDIKEEIKSADIAFLDGTFLADGELPGRDMSEIPHPFIEESKELFSDLSEQDRAKINFIHFNHTNPLWYDPVVHQQLKLEGFMVAFHNQRIEL